MSIIPYLAVLLVAGIMGEVHTEVNKLPYKFGFNNTFGRTMWWRRGVPMIVHSVTGALSVATYSYLNNRSISEN